MFLLSIFPSQLDSTLMIASTRQARKILSNFLVLPNVML